MLKCFIKQFVKQLDPEAVPNLSEAKIKTGVCRPSGKATY